MSVRVILAIASCAFLGACAPPSQSTTSAAPQSGVAQPKRITAAVMSNPHTISRDNVSAGSGTYPGGDALEGLLNGGLSYTDVQGQLAPVIAEAVPTTDNGLWKVSADGTMETTWNLRPNANWHDGTPITAADLVFTATLARDKDLPVFGSRDWDYVSSVQAIDDRTITARWKTTYIRANALFIEVRPEHILGNAYRGPEKNAVLQAPYWKDQYVGAGPFKLKELVTDSHLIVVANDNYFFGRPKIDEITIKFIPDPNTLVANILSGDVSLVLGRNLSIRQAEEVKTHWAKGTTKFDFNNWIALWPQFLNPNPQVLLKPDFRKALTYGLNRQEIVDTLLNGVPPVAHTFVAPTEAVYRQIEPQIVKYDYDPRQAMQIVTELGYTLGGDGLFRDAAGQTINLEVRTSADDETQTSGILSVADNFRRVGIDATPFLIPQAQRDDREFNATFPGVRLWRQANDIWGLDRLESKNATLPENKFSGGNRSRYMNPEFDAMIDKYIVTVSERDRVPLLGQIVHFMTDNATMIDLWYDTRVTVMDSRLRNVTNAALNAEQWDLVNE